MQCDYKRNKTSGARHLFYEVVKNSPTRKNEKSQTSSIKVLSFLCIVYI